SSRNKVTRSNRVIQSADSNSASPPGRFNHTADNAIPPKVVQTMLIAGANSRLNTAECGTYISIQAMTIGVVITAGKIAAATTAVIFFEMPNCSVSHAA